MFCVLLTWLFDCNFVISQNRPHVSKIKYKNTYVFPIFQYMVKYENKKYCLLDTVDWTDCSPVQNGKHENMNWTLTSNSFEIFPAGNRNKYYGTNQRHYHHPTSFSVLLLSFTRFTNLPLEVLQCNLLNLPHTKLQILRLFHRLPPSFPTLLACFKFFKSSLKISDLNVRREEALRSRLTDSVLTHKKNAFRASGVRNWLQIPSQKSIFCLMVFDVCLVSFETYASFLNCVKLDFHLTFRLPPRHFRWWCNAMSFARTSVRFPLKLSIANIRFESLFTK